MRAIYMTIERFLELKQRMMGDPNYKPEIHEVVNYDENYPDLSLINENWVKVRVKLGGICGSDMNIIKLQNSTVLSTFTSLPAVPGHEIVGEIIETGNNVKNLKIGDRIICDTNISCEARGLELCEQCQAGNYNLCYNQDKGEIAPGLVMGLCKDTGGGWGEFIVIHESQAYKIPDEITWEQALIAEPISCAIHGILKVNIRKEDITVVIGCGTIGLATISVLNALSDCKILATARYEYQAELARKLGADDVFITKKDKHIKRIARELGCRVVTPVLETVYPVGGGADIVIDSVGNASSLKDSLRLIKPRGTVLLIGYPGMINVDWSPIVAKEINLIASNIFSYDTIDGEKKKTMEIALDFIKSGKVDVSDFLTHTFPLKEYKEALKLAEKKSNQCAVKIAFSPEFS